MIDYNTPIEEIAKKAAGDWKKIDNFVWFDSPEDEDTWTIISPEHRDSTLIDKSNSEAIQAALGADEFSDDVIIGSATHWAVGWVTHICIRVYDAAGNITPAFRELVDIQLRLQEYPVLDDEDYSRREYEASLWGIEDSCRTELTCDTPEDWKEKVFSWLWDSEEHQRELENTDDTGAYPSSESIHCALVALGWAKRDVYTIRIPVLGDAADFFRVAGKVEVYTTRRAAESEIVDDLEIHIQEWKDGERPFDDIEVNGYIEDWKMDKDGVASNESGETLGTDDYKETA